MKYWNELTQLEEEIIQLQTLKSLMNVVANGLQSSNSEDVMNTFYMLESMVGEIQEKSSEKFNKLFSVIRDDTSADISFNFPESENFEVDVMTVDVPQTMNMSDNIESYDFSDLDNVVREWTKKS